MHIHKKIYKIICIIIMLTKNTSFLWTLQKHPQKRIKICSYYYSFISDFFFFSKKAPRLWGARKQWVSVRYYCEDCKRIDFWEILNPILSIYFWQLKYTGSDPEELFLKNTCFLEKNEYTDTEKVCGVRTGSD